MHHVWFISILLLPSIALADDMTTTGTIPYPAPPYQPLRFNEDYSYLTNTANRSDWFDSVKYIQQAGGHDLDYASATLDFLF
jgi:hypothetical protein